MSVEALNATNPADQSADTGTTINTSSDDALGAVFDKYERDNGAGRGEDGRFRSDNPSPSEGDGNEPLEGGEGEGATGEISTPPVDVPLPTNWKGKEELWGKIPADIRSEVAEHAAGLHKTLSEQGRVLASLRPYNDVASKYQDYWNGTKGNQKPADAFDALMEIQVSMDSNPIETILGIAKMYGVTDDIAARFAGKSGSAEGAESADGGVTQTDTVNRLLDRIADLERTIKESADPSKIDARISAKLMEESTVSETKALINRLSADMPLYAEVEADLKSFIPMAWDKLGNTASQEAVLKRAYDMAVNADPDLRAKATALRASAVAPDPKRVEEAKRANATNLRSHSTGKPREASEEELLGAVFDKHSRG